MKKVKDTPLEKLYHYFISDDFEMDILDACIAGFTREEVMLREIVAMMAYERECLEEAHDVGSVGTFDYGGDFFEGYYMDLENE